MTRKPPREERPDPRPTKAPGPLKVVEDGVRLSESRVWRLQRAFFEKTDPSAWSQSRVPSYITTNAFVARSMARVVAAFLDDVSAGRLGAHDARRPVDIVELGAGSGRFAYGFLRELGIARRIASRAGAKARYVLTDLAPAPIAALRANPRFAPFVREGLLDFAVLDAESPGEVHLLESGDVLRPARDADPVVAIANYFFDGIPADLFEVAGGRLRESHLRLSCPEDADPDDPRTIGKLVTSFETGPEASAPYGDAELDALLFSLASRMADGHFLFPVAGLRLVRHLRAMGGGRLLLLAADRGHVHEEALLGLEPPYFERHGSFSLDVNFHALAEHARASGGHAMLPAHHPSHLATIALLWGAKDADATRAHEAFEASLDAGGPEDFFVLKRTLERQKDRLDLERALSWIRASAWDGEVFHLCVPTILAHLDAAPPGVRLDVLDAARRVRERYFPIGEERDVPFALGEVFDALDALPEAEAAFAESMALRGESADTLHRMAVCASSLHRLDDALSLLERALAIDPTYEPARAMRVALRADVRRRR